MNFWWIVFIILWSRCIVQIGSFTKHFRNVIQERKSVKINNKLYNCNCRDKLLAINCHHSWCAMKNTQWMKQDNIIWMEGLGVVVCGASWRRGTCSLGDRRVIYTTNLFLFLMSFLISYWCPTTYQNLCPILIFTMCNIVSYYYISKNWRFPYFFVFLHICKCNLTV